MSRKNNTYINELKLENVKACLNIERSKDFDNGGSTHGEAPYTFTDNDSWDPVMKSKAI